MQPRTAYSELRKQNSGYTRPRLLRALIAAATALLVVVSALIPGTAAFAYGDAAVRNIKSASVTAVGPGDTFNWMIEAGCSVLEDECVNAVLTDKVPAEFIPPAPEDILLTPVLSDSERTITVSGQTVTVAFHQDLAKPAGQKGLENGTVTVTIPVTVRSDLDYTPTPRTVQNTSKMVADNAPMHPSTASVQLTVPLKLATQPTEYFSPATNIAVAGLGTKLTVGGSNTSNAPVSSLTIQDPVNPATSPNIFHTTLKLQTLESVTWPTGATSAVVSLWDTSLFTPAWVDASAVNSGGTLTLPTGVVLANAGGIRIVFSSGTAADISRYASANFVLGLKNRAGVTAGTYPNTVQSTVVRGTLSADKSVTANYGVTIATSTVSAGKSITPSQMSTVVFGNRDLTRGTVTLSGGVTGSIPLTSLTISEPSAPASLDELNSLAPAHTGGGLIFSGFTGAVAWPAGATAATITYYFQDGTHSTTLVTAVGSLPSSGSTKRVTGFSITFTGTMAKGAAATVPFRIKANPAQVAPNLKVEYTNTIKVTGTDVYNKSVDPKSATDTVTVFADQVNLETTKTLSRSLVRAVAGQTTTATLTTHVSGYPRSTRALSHIEMIDPSTGTGLTDWYKYFNAAKLIVTSVPGGATLNISYRNSAGTYTSLTTLNSGTNNYVIPAATRGSIYGLKLSWKSSTGFQPGQTLVANVEYALRSSLRGGSTLPNAKVVLNNCSSSSGGSSGGLVSKVVQSNPCPETTLVPYDGSSAGAANLLTKKFINLSKDTDQSVMNTGNRAQTRVRLSWSTDNYTGVKQMVIYDGAVDSSKNPDPAAWNNKGMYDAYNLTRIPKISLNDPLMQYDKVVIEFYNKVNSAWESISGYCAVTSPCDGDTVAKQLNGAQRTKYVAVRFKFTEGSNRKGVNPALGSGVAASGSHNRHIDLIYQMRYTLRSDANSPVVDGYKYNADLTAGASPHSVIRNDAQAKATFSNSDSLHTWAHDTLELRDPPLAVAVDKKWTGGPVSIPSSSGSVRPTSRVSITATNQTIARVDSLTISEPNTTTAIPNGSPFEDWDLARFQSIGQPKGATGLTVTVTRTVGGSLTASGTLTAVTTTVMGWTKTQLADATAFTFVYTGRIKAQKGKATIVFDLALRTAKRGGGAISAGTDYNSTEAIVADKRWESTSPVTAPTFVDATLSARNDASISLVALNISVTTSKTFGRASETEANRSIFPLTLIATPGGSERVKTLTITDDRATFWNAFNFTGMASHKPTLPVFSPTSADSATVIQVEACVGGTWTASAVSAAPNSNCTDRGGHWVGAGTWKTQAQAQAGFLPSGVTVGQVEGFRMTFKRLDNSQWENPQAPKVSIPILVQRRINLRTGALVLSDLASNAVSPGESAPGSTTNSLQAGVLGILGHDATAANSASYLFKHANTGVQVLKRPAGLKAPGRIFDYTLKVTNTGAWPILNPVITDYLPTDGGSAQLIFDPDNPWTYKYTLTGAAPSSPNGTALPTGTAGPTVAVVPDTNGYGPKQIQFTFPAGSVLEVGQVYVITVPMMFRPGIENDATVTNRFGIRGDRAFDSCTAPAGITAKYDNPSGECSTSTTVRLSAQAALRALMTVKANLDSDFPTDQGFTGGSNPDCTAAKDSNGFSRPPCIPRTLPGQKETWRLTAENTGTTNMPRLVLSTRLPDVGDQTILDKFVRGSRWKARFADEITANIGPGATMTVSYTTATLPCKLVLQNPSNTNACGNDAATGWAPWSAGTLADPTVVTGLQFVIDFNSAQLFKPADKLNIDIGTRTAVLSATPGVNTTANNSMSASAITRTGSTDTSITALDYSVVSVALRWAKPTVPNVPTNPFSLAYTGVDRDAFLFMLLPIGLLLFGGLLVGFSEAKRRRNRRMVSSE